MKVKIKKLTETAVVPKKAHPTDAGFDLTTTSVDFDRDGNLVYHTGLAFEIPEGYAGFLFPRSSNCKKDLAFTNCVGVIDCHYRGEVTMKFRPALCFNPFKDNQRIYDNAGISFAGPVELTNSAIRYGVGDRIGQLIILPIPDIEFEETDELSETDRGVGGYGSSGR